MARLRGKGFHLEDRIRIMHARAVKGHPGRMERPGAGGYQDDLGAQVTRPALLEGYAHSVSVRQAGLAPDGFDMVVLQVTGDGGPLGLNQGLLPAHDLADIQVRVERVIDAIRAPLAQAGVGQGRLAQRLGMGAGVQAGARRCRWAGGPPRPLFCRNRPPGRRLSPRPVPRRSRLDQIRNFWSLCPS